MVVYLKCLYFKPLKFYRKPDPVTSSDDDDLKLCLVGSLLQRQS